MISVLVAALVAAAAPPDTVYTLDGGRITGIVMEESAAAGVTIQTPDGAVRRIERAQVFRIEYADGTVSPPPPPRPPEPAMPPHASGAAGPQDVVHFVGGGRVRGTVIEESPRSGVRVRQLDGTYQVYTREEVARIDYADGSVSQVAPEAAALPAPAAEPPRPFPLYLTLGLGGTFLGGDATRQVSMGDLFGLQQIHVSTEFGLRLTTGWALGVYADAGGGDPSSSVNRTCEALGKCTASAGRIGFLVRHAWDPLSQRPIWLSLGTGWEYAGITVDRRGTPGGATSGSRREDLFTYAGREHLRLGVGIDFRTSRVVGIGLYGSVAAGSYDTRKDEVAKVGVDRALHTTAQIGARLILFP
jgi:hypothetical protein